MTIHPSKPLVPSDKTARLRASDRVVGILSDRIRSGLYSAGDLLPTERDLAADLRVHRRSVRSAINQLAQDGFVSRRPNCRPTVGRFSPDELENGSRKTTADISASNLVALIMWHGGGPLEYARNSQQRIFWGMNQSLMNAGYHAVFLNLGEGIGTAEDNAAREAEHLHYIRDRGFGGALFYPYAYRYNHDLVREVSRDVPLVLLDRKIVGVDTDFVGIKNYEALLDVTQHLIARGHRRIAHVTRSEPIQPVLDRIQGYLDAMRGMDAASATEIILNIAPYADDRAWTVVDAVFRLPAEQRPTAAVCLNDYMAASLAERLQHLGLKIPEDVAITGVDNIVPILPGGAGLTTMAQPYEEIGTTAVELLLRRIKDRHAPPVSVELPAHLIIRASSET